MEAFQTMAKNQPKQEFLPVGLVSQAIKNWHDWLH